MPRRMGAGLPQAAALHGRTRHCAPPPLALTRTGWRSSAVCHTEENRGRGEECSLFSIRKRACGRVWINLDLSESKVLPRSIAKIFFLRKRGFIDNVGHGPQNGPDFYFHLILFFLL